MQAFPHLLTTKYDKIDYISQYDVSQPFRKDFIQSSNIDLMAYLPNFTKTEYEMLAEFRYALRHYLRFSKNAVETAGITLQQHQALLFIMGYPNREQITIGELAERLQIKHHSAVGLVNRLEEQGLVERKQNEGDRRQVLIGLTQKGVAILESLASLHREELRHLGPQLCALLERITNLNGRNNPPDQLA
jgi:DNA-binding MarR family transcriptional regulator